MNEGVPEAGRPRHARTVGIAYNLRKHSDSAVDDRYEEYDSIETIEALEGELHRLGFETVRLEQDENFYRNLSENSPDFVFNIAEGLGTDRGRESQVPCALESLGIPYSGSDSVSLALSLDKFLTHRMLAAAGVPVADMCLVRDEADLEKAEALLARHGTCIAKPRWEGSSKGVFSDSICSSAETLAKAVRRIWGRYGEPALVEEFLPGEEFTVGILGNTTPWAAGIMRLSSKRMPEQERFLYCIENKREWEGNMVYEGPGAFSPETRRGAERSALAAFGALELRDVARIDVRFDRGGMPKVMDVNPLPGLSPHYGDFPILYRLCGGTWENLVHTILREAFTRSGLAWEEA